MNKKKKLFAFVLTQKIAKKTQYLAGLAIVFLVSAFCFLFSGYIGPEVVAFIQLLVLSVVAMFFDILPVLMVAVLSVLSWDFLFLHPRFQFIVGNTEDEIMLSMYFIIAMINAVLTFKIRQIEKKARRKEEKVQTFKLYNTLLNSISHEFRTPIATIVAATDNLLAKPQNLSAGLRLDLVQEISRASLRLNQQVENLLNMSRLDSGFIQPRKAWCDIGELVLNLIQRLDDELSRHRVEIEIQENLPLCRIDHGLMEQVFRNLIHNATQYTPEKSLIRISIDGMQQMLVIGIEDNGPGFPDEETGRVFDKFYRLRNAPLGGTGLGLSIVKGFVEAHQGTIDLRKGPLGGAAFTIKIPTEKYFAENAGYIGYR